MIQSTCGLVGVACDVESKSDDKSDNHYEGVLVRKSVRQYSFTQTSNRHTDVNQYFARQARV